LLSRLRFNLLGSFSLGGFGLGSFGLGGFSLRGFGLGSSNSFFLLFSLGLSSTTGGSTSSVDFKEVLSDLTSFEDKVFFCFYIEGVF